MYIYKWNGIIHENAQCVLHINEMVNYNMINEESHRMFFMFLFCFAKRQNKNKQTEQKQNKKHVFFLLYKWNSELWISPIENLTECCSIFYNFNLQVFILEDFYKYFHVKGARAIASEWCGMFYSQCQFGSFTCIIDEDVNVLFFL